MRHRLVHVAGLGNPEPVILNNKGKLNKQFADHVLELYFKDFDGFDYSVTKKAVTVGIEPAYQYEKLRIVSIAKDIGESFVWYGKAFGPYGSKILGKKRYFKDFKKDCKFTRLVKKFHGELFGAKA